MENRELSRKIYIPQIIDNDNEYYDALKMSFRVYVRYISDNKTFDLSAKEKIKVRSICDKILNSLSLYYEGKIQGATAQISEILEHVHIK